jgi:hypothetical protein
MTDQPSGLRDLYAAHARAGTPHVEEAAWERLALEACSPAERERVLDHVVRCAECASVYRALGELEAGARAFDPGAPTGPVLSEADLGVGLRPWGFLGGLAAAAAVVWALARPALAPAPAPLPSPEVMRGADPARPRALEPMGHQRATPAFFRWEPQAGARAYRVEVFDASGEPLWKSPEVSGTSLAWPAALSVKPGTYYWQVVALAGSGQPADAVASPMASFEITPGS